MASFTEQATLRVVDQSSAQLRKINAELKKLFATAKSLKSIKIDIRVNDKGLSSATAKAKALAAALRTLRSKSIDIKANVSGIAAASRQITNLRQQAARAITVRTQHAGGAGGAGGPPGGRGTHFGGGGYRRTPGSAFIGGVGGGLGMGLARLNDSFGGLAVAGFAAAKALHAVAAAAQARDRALLAVDTQTSAAQREVFKQADAEAKARGEYKGALRYKEDQFNLARSSFLGDVGNSKDIDPKSRAGEVERAARADLLARTLYRDVVPGMFARNPNLTQQESQEELKKYVQILGTTTQNMFEKDAQGRLQLSADYKRVAEGLRLAQIGAPDLTMGQMKTAAAAIKSLGYTATPMQIAEILFNVSAKGQRAANEAYQMYKTGLGVTDVGKLNTAIEDLGLFIPGTAKRNPKSNKVIAGTGVPVQFTDEEGQPIKLGERPSEWWREAMKSPEVQARAREMLVKQAEAALPKGATKAQRAKARADAENKYKEGEATAVTDYINRALAGARGTALQGILDSILGGDVAKAGLAQAGVAPTPEEVNKRMEQSWSVQFSNLSTAASDAAAKLGELAASTINLTGILKGLTAFVDQNPLASAGIAIAVGTAVGVAMIAPAGLLIRAAGALTSAGIALGGKVVPGGTPGGAAGAAGAGGSIIRRVGGVLMRFAGGVGVALTAEEIARYIATRSDAEAKADENRVQAAKDLAVKEAAAARIQQEQDVQRDTPQSAAQQAYMAQQAEKLEGIKAEIERLKAVLDPTRKPPEEVKPVEPPADAKPATADDIKAAVTAAVLDHAKATTPPATPPVTPTAAATATTAAAVPPQDTLAALIPQLAKTSESITLSITGLATAGTTFATVFQTGATAIGNSGQTAASALTGAAPGIGAAIGNSAATAIRAAVSNLSINVNANVKGGGADTGSQKASGQ